MAEWDLFLIEYCDPRDTMDYMEQNGVSGLERHLEERMNQWHNVPIRVAVIGSSGVGKSTFINSIRNLTGDDEGAAPVGVCETTMEPTCFPHPYNSNVEFWDLPGVGTARFPKETYLKDIQVERYDFFLILSDRRFTENDAWLAREVHNVVKQFFFVRTKIDEDVKDDSAETPEEIQTKISCNIKQSLKACNLENSPIYFVCNFDLEDWDFPKLMEHIFQALPTFKKQAMVLSLGNLSHNVIREKTKLLKSQVWMAALTSAAAGAVPLPGVDIAVDVIILIQRTQFFLKQYGIDDDSLGHLADRTGTTKEYYKEALVRSKSILLTRDGIASALKALVMKKVSNDVPIKLLKLIPLIGGIVNGSVSFGTTYFFLCDMITRFDEDAHNVLDRVFDRQVKSASAV